MNASSSTARLEEERLYNILVNADGEWISTNTLAIKSKVLRRRIGDRIYTIRKRLPKNLRLEGKRHLGYRLLLNEN